MLNGRNPSYKEPMKSLIFTLAMSSMLSTQAIAVESCRVLFSSSEITLTENQVRELVTNSRPYQDKRNKEWLDQRECLCCHTSLPFVLSRGIDQNSRENFDKYRVMAAEKVEDANARPWYTSDHAGQNSKPTEAVLNAITLLMFDLSSHRPLQPVTLKSLDRIFENVGANGRLHWLDYDLEPFESKKGEVWGNSMAILAVEMAKKNSSYNPPAAKYRALKNSTMENPAEIHPNEMSVLLWANSFDASVLKPAQVSAYAQKIRSTQNADGSWNQKAVLGQGQSTPTAYATAIALIGLINSGEHGNSIDKAAAWLALNQNETGGNPAWNSVSMNRPNSRLNNTFSTDYATSYSSLALKMYHQLRSVP